MKWSEEYATGIPQIDKQHKNLFSMVDDFYLALEEGGGERVYGNLLKLLDRYARSHFRYEEKCMDEYQCPVAAKNKKAHERLVSVLGGYQQRYNDNGFDVGEAYELVELLNNWLTNHICMVDLQLKDYVDKS